MRNIIGYFREHPWEGIICLVLIGAISGYFGLSGLYLFATISIDGKEASGKVIGVTSIRSTKVVDYVFNVNGDIVRNQVSADVLVSSQFHTGEEIIVVYDQFRPNRSFPKTMFAVSFFEVVFLTLVGIGSLLWAIYIWRSLNGRFS